MGIQYVENGDSYTENWGVVSCYDEIPKEEYERLSALSYKELDELVESTMGESIIWGYGYYGCGLHKDNEKGKYYLYYKRGSTCD